jgi:hypothetical protein
MIAVSVGAWKEITMIDLKTRNRFAQVNDMWNSCLRLHAKSSCQGAAGILLEFNIVSHPRFPAAMGPRYTLPASPLIVGPEKSIDMLYKMKYGFGEGASMAKRKISIPDACEASWRSRRVKFWPNQTKRGEQITTPFPRIIPSGCQAGICPQLFPQSLRSILLR